MDEAGIEARGIAPLKPYLSRIEAIANRQDLARAFGEANRIGVTHPFRLNVWIDAEKSDQNVPYIGQSGLGLPGRAFYLDDGNAKFAELRAKYQGHLSNMLRLVF